MTSPITRKAFCASLAGAITDFGPHKGHAAYVARLRAEHGRKSGFWGLIA